MGNCIGQDGKLFIFGGIGAGTENYLSEVDLSDLKITSYAVKV